MPTVTLSDGRKLVLKDGATKEQIAAAVEAASAKKPVEQVPGPQPEPVRETANGDATGGGFMDAAARVLRGVREAVEPPVALQEGGLMGLRGEVAGVVGGVKSALEGEGFAGGFEREQAAADAELDAAREDRPILSTALQIAGGFGGVGNVAAPALNTLKGIGVAAAQGGGLGALSGAATAKGDIENRIVGGLTGGTVGATLAGGLAAIPPLARAFQGVLAPIKKIKNPDRVARRLVLRAFERDGIGPDDAAKMLKQWEAQGAKPEVLADLGGQNVKGLLRAAQATPSSAKSHAFRKLTERQETQGLRLEDDLAATLRLEKRGFYDVMDDLMEARAAQAQPLYDEANKVGPLWSDKLKDLAKRPSMARAYKRAREIAAEEGVDLPVSFKTNADDQITDVLEVPDQQTWDYVKRGLDDILERYRDGTTGRLNLDTLGHRIDGTRRALLEELDDLNPAYRAARDVWSDKTTALDAMDRGRQFILRDVEVTGKDIAALPEAQKAFFKVGAYRQLVDMIRRTPDGGDAARKIFGTPQKREAIKALFEGDDAAFDLLSKLVERERNMASTRQEVLGNSVTARLTKELEDLSDKADFWTAAINSRGNLTEALASVGLRRADAALRGMDDRVASEVGNLLAQPGKAGVEALAVPARRVAPTGRAGTSAAGVAGGVLGGQAAN